MKEHAYFFSSCSVLVLGVQNIFCSRSVLVRENQQNFVLVLFSFSNMFPNNMRVLSLGSAITTQESGLGHNNST